MLWCKTKSEVQNLRSEDKSIVDKILETKLKMSKENQLVFLNYYHMVHCYLEFSSPLLWGLSVFKQLLKTIKNVAGNKVETTEI